MEEDNNLQDVTVDISSAVATITINRPSARNAIGIKTIHQFSQALDEVLTSDARVLVIRGGGDRAFISGGDLKDFKVLRDEDSVNRMATSMRRVLDRLGTYPLPVIAALNGHTLGGGAEVAIAADIRIAASDITIGFTQVRLAIMPAWGGVERLVELVGRSQAMLLIATGQTFNAEAAKKIGLVDLVVPRAEFDEAWRKLAQTFANLPKSFSLAIKELASATRPNSHVSTERLAIQAFANLWTADEHWDALNKYETRTPSQRN